MTSSKTAPTTRDHPFLPHETLGYALKRAQQAMRLHMDRQLQEIGLNAPQYNVLASLEAEPGASNARLARRAFVTPQTMQAMLVKLEQAGLIQRRPDTEHGRIQRTELTERGRSSLAQAHLAAQKSERLAREASSPDAVEMLTRVAEALA
ncbi:DNA-binding MarR family transcriptional regulator [Rhodoligotrophos appendicifer]|uniref:MarR family winged helix-turn-helix transcriptional regulator n=1 Tax=Rhodoligotrophos appendicifer TaxID=987056 RepID=UPI001185B386|nr:MarR family transcriptional regulator [Rhodoligotrophos appendicifer]